MAYSDFTPKKTSTFKRCAHDHPALPVGKDLVIYGGACSDPIVPNIDVSVGLDFGFRLSRDMYPWDGNEQVYFHIDDMGVPSNVGQFKKLLTYLEKNIRAGKVVHVGCIGGHGRTGLVFSALVSIMLPDTPSPTAYVRENYCKKAVESNTQTAWLLKHFGIKKEKPTKGAGSDMYTKNKPQAGFLSAKDIANQKQYGLGLVDDPLEDEFGDLDAWRGNLPTEKLEYRPSNKSGKYVSKALVTPLDGPDSIWWGGNLLTPTLKKIK